MATSRQPQRLDPAATLAMPSYGLKLIEASAGTGKTYTIANLYLRYILEGYSVAQILVVTFTKAATEELRGRVHTRLQQALQLFQSPHTSQDEFLALLLAQSEHPQAIYRLQLAARSMDEAAIFTIHGYCQRALIDHPFQSGQNFEMEFMNYDGDLWNEALKDWWRRNTYPRQRSEIYLLQQALGSLEYFLHLQEEYRNAGEAMLIPQAQDTLVDIFQKWQALAPALQQIAKQWAARKETLIAILNDSPALSRSVKSGYKKEILAEKLQHLERYFTSEEWLPFPAEFTLVSSGSLEKHSKPQKRGSDIQLNDAFFQACQSVCTTTESLSQALRIATLRSAAHYAQQQVEQHKQQQSTLAFQDQLNRLRDALLGAHGQQLSKSLRQRFPIALIDEFQDTDAVQYDIFRTLYQDAADTSMIMIGDPKQAIYSFRGGDIFTYMQAREDVSTHYTLGTNWRSVPLLINALNAVFGIRETPFLYQAIDYLPVLAATAAQKQTPHTLFLENGEAIAPLSLWQIPLDAKQKAQSKTSVSEKVVQATASEIARLLKAGQTGQCTLGQKPVTPGDIAVLVRTSYEGSDIRNALYALGVNAVTVGHERVFQSEEAQGLGPLLQAVLHHKDRALARQALTSHLLQLRYREIAEVLHQEEPWLAWLDQLRALHQKWQQQGFMCMFQALLQTRQLGLTIARAQNADRRLTNLLHIAELIQQASKAHPGMDALLAWFHQQTQESESEEAELRLESDDSLVKIVTIHTSKGLEYPIVFLPFLWNCKPKAHNDALLHFHDSARQAFIDAGSDERDKHLRLAEKERLAEDIRLAYVALTRAKAKLYLAWGAVKRNHQNIAGQSALGYLLHAGQSPEDLDQALPQAFDANADLNEALQQLVEKAKGGIELLPLPSVSTAPPATTPEAPLPSLPLAKFTGKIAANWRIASFSSLTRDIHQSRHGGSARSEDDVILNFPAGSHVGSFLHLLLEHLDFQGNIEQQSHDLSQKYAARFQLDPESIQDTLALWLQNIVATPLAANGLCLQQLPPTKRLNELEFHLALRQLHIAKLNQQLQQSAGQTLTHIEVGDFRGLLTGIIDLVFEYQGKFYLADYKSNYLGGALPDYNPDKLQKAVLDRRYDLQYLIYSLALHRYLQQRLPHYTYEDHFGGAYYLFLRAMRPTSGPKYGVYFHKPETTLLRCLDEQIFAYRDR